MGWLGGQKKKFNFKVKKCRNIASHSQSYSKQNAKVWLEFEFFNEFFTISKNCNLKQIPVVKPFDYISCGIKCPHFTFLFATF
jgi:hypothetical protein